MPVFAHVFVFATNPVKQFNCAQDFLNAKMNVYDLLFNVKLKAYQYTFQGDLI